MGQSLSGFNILLLTLSDTAEEAASADQVVRDIRAIATERGRFVCIDQWPRDAKPGSPDQSWAEMTASANLIVGVLWARDEQEGASISERIEQLTPSARCDLWLYFRKAPVDPELYEQVGRIQQLKKRSQQIGPREYADPVAFHRQFQIHLELALQQGPAPAPRKPGSGYDYELYRRMARSTEMWKPAGPAPPGNRPISVSLEEMYQELRLGDSPDEEGAPLTPAQVAQLAGARLVLEGPAGCGKTTWITHTMERLLRDAPDRFPILLELRGLNAHTHLPMVKLVEQAFAARGFPVASLEDALTAADAPPPVLLVDGWDELGATGETFRKNLHAYLEQHRQATAIVTTRPTAADKPSTYQSFAARYFQPLNEEEQQKFARRFWEKYYGTESDWEDSFRRFLESWERATEVRNLGSNPMQLSMMLVIGRSEQLPDRRHRLYEVCVNHLLSRRTQAGPDEWRPEDDVERRKAVAYLAFRMQAARKTYPTDAGVVFSTTDLQALLPPTIERRGDFLRWLVNQAGLLRDRADGRLQFAHLSYQDYAAGRHFLFDQTAPEEIVKKAEAAEWWETLRLWAGLAHDEQPKTLDAVIPEIPASLRGCMFADGAGTEARFHEWLADYAPGCAAGLPNDWEACARAWGASRQETKQLVFTSFDEVAIQAGWVAWIRIREWKAEAGEPQPPVAAILLPVVRSFDAVDGQAEVALGRVWGFGYPLWPDEPWELGLLNVWPSRRRLIGGLLQAMAVLGFGVAELRSAAGEALRNSATRGSQYWASNFMRSLTREWNLFVGRQMPVFWRDWALDLARDLTRYLARYPAQYLARPLARYTARYWPWYSERYPARELVLDWARQWVRYSMREWARYGALGLGPQFSPGLALKGSSRQQVQELASLLLTGPAVVAERATLAHLNAAIVVPEVQLMQRACRQSLNGQPDMLPTKGIADPLWPALARHLSRQSTEEDRSLLDHLARHPEERPAPLCWGLDHIVGGRIMMPGQPGDGIPFDEILPGLPYLDEMEPELELPDE